MIEYIYHGTTMGAAISIQREGKMKLFLEPYISFSSHYRVSRYYSMVKGGSDRNVILRTILTNEFSLSPKFKHNNGHEWITDKEIPIDKLEVETIQGWVPLSKWDFIDKKIMEMKYLKRFSLFEDYMFFKDEDRATDYWMNYHNAVTPKGEPFHHKITKNQIPVIEAFYMNASIPSTTILHAIVDKHADKLIMSVEGGRRVKVIVPRTNDICYFDVNKIGFTGFKRLIEYEYLAYKNEDNDWFKNLSIQDKLIYIKHGNKLTDSQFTQLL